MPEWSQSQMHTNYTSKHICLLAYWSTYTLQTGTVGLIPLEVWHLETLQSNYHSSRICPPFWGWHSVSNRKWGFTEAGCSASSHSLKPFSRTPPRLFSSHSWCRQGICRTDAAELQGSPSKSEWNFRVPPCFGKLISTGFDFDSFKPQICDKKRLEHVGTSFGVLWVMPFWNIRKSGTTDGPSNSPTEQWTIVNWQPNV